MYRYEKKRGRVKNFFRTILLMFVTSLVSIILYKMYLNIEIETEPIAQDLYSNQVVRLATDIEKEKFDINEILEKSTKCVVRHIKNKKYRRWNFR